MTDSIICICAISAEHWTGGVAVLICAAGDIHGAINRFYDDVLTFEISLGTTFDWVLRVGDFGISRDPERIDRATRNHDGARDFSEWLGAMRPVPRRTVFIKGNHEDFAWLRSGCLSPSSCSAPPRGFSTSTGIATSGSLLRLQDRELRQHLHC